MFDTTSSKRKVSGPVQYVALPSNQNTKTGALSLGTSDGYNPKAIRRNPTRRTFHTHQPSQCPPGTRPYANLTCLASLARPNSRPVLLPRQKLSDSTSETFAGVSRTITNASPHPYCNPPNLFQNRQQLSKRIPHAPKLRNTCPSSKTACPTISASPNLGRTTPPAHQHPAPELDHPAQTP